MMDDPMDDPMSDDLQGFEPGLAPKAKEKVHTPQIERLLKTELPVIVLLAERQLELRDIVGMAPGSVMEFSKPADEPLDVLINNCPVARGEAVRVGEHFGVQIQDIGNPRERIERLGGRR